eukprot:4394697-Lingulodinium_polyedra.AAC.1
MIAHTHLCLRPRQGALPAQISEQPAAARVAASPVAHRGVDCGGLVRALAGHGPRRAQRLFNGVRSSVPDHREG